MLCEHRLNYLTGTFEPILPSHPSADRLCLSLYFNIL